MPLAEAGRPLCEESGGAGGGEGGGDGGGEGGGEGGGKGGGEGGGEGGVRGENKEHAEDTDTGERLAALAAAAALAVHGLTTGFCVPCGAALTLTLTLPLTLR